MPPLATLTRHKPLSIILPEEEEDLEVKKLKFILESKPLTSSNLKAFESRVSVLSEQRRSRSFEGDNQSEKGSERLLARPHLRRRSTGEKPDLRRGQSPSVLSTISDPNSGFNRHVRFKEEKQAPLAIPEMSNGRTSYLYTRNGRSLVRRHSLSDMFSVTATVTARTKHNKGHGKRRKSTSVLPPINNERKYMLKTQCSPQFAETLTEIEKKVGGLDAEFQELCLFE